MKISMKLDASAFEAKTKKQIKNLAYSVQQALNDTALQVQARIQGDLRAKFRLRKPANQKGWAGAQSEYSAATGDSPSRSEQSWLVKQIKVFTFANVKKGKLYAEVGIGQRPRLLLSMFETGGMREPAKGKNVAVPNPDVARDGSINKQVSPKYMYKALKMKKYKTKSEYITTKYKKKYGVIVKKYKSKESKVQRKGLERTFMINKPTAKLKMGGIYQRVGPKRGDIRVVYSFQKAFRIRKTLNFINQSKEVYEKQFRENFYKRFYKLNS